jgi:hypothetical protein
VTRLLGRFAVARTGPARRRVAAFALVAGMVAAVVTLPAAAIAGPLSSWTPPASIPSAETHAQAPALAEYDGLLYAVWAGQSSPYHLWYAAFNGTSWSGQAEIPAALTNYETGPSVAVYDGDLYVAWQAQSLPTNIWYSAFNGTSWTGQTELKTAEAFNSSISGLAVYNGDLYLAWETESFAVDYAAFNGSTWSTPTAVPSAESKNFESADVPLAVYNGDLYVSWESPTHYLTYSYFDGATWSSPQSLAARSDAGPALATMGDELYLAWNNYSKLDVDYKVFNGTTWTSEKPVPDATYSVETGPGIAPYDGSMYIAWLPTFDPSPIDYSSKS